jgi:hypothetical protein
MLWLALGGVVLLAILVGALFLWLQQVPSAYPLSSNPIPPPSAKELGGGLDGFDSPYLGHTGSWNGRGGAWGGSKIADLDTEAAMGLRWTFMPVYWRALEPDGPVDLSQETPPAWQELDAFIVAAHSRRLNVLMQAPVVGGNAGGPPAWAGRRDQGKSAPANMVALAEFAGKLAQRYHPGGMLAQREGWGTNYGVRAWELDNEPESYFTCWKGQAADYAEFVTLAADRIRAVDPEAVLVAPGMSAGMSGLDWLRAVLDPDTTNRSAASAAAPRRSSIGPGIDVVSLHNYEGLDSAFARRPRTIGQVFDDVRRVFEEAEHRHPGFGYLRKQDYWHTEGNFDFIGALSANRRAAWRFQFFTRAFACGIRKVCVMDASPQECRAIKAYVTALPQPFPMLVVSNQVRRLRGDAFVFHHPDGPDPPFGQVWVAWAPPGNHDAEILIPVRHSRVHLVTPDGRSQEARSMDGQLRVLLPSDPKMSPPVLVIDRPASH